MENGYIIHIGTENTQTAIVAYPDKDGKPTGEPIERVIRVGTHQMLNRARVWGRRIIKSGTEVKTVDKDGGEILFNTTGFKGEIEFLPWGEDGGQALEIRYLPQSNSLDFEFQENIQRIKIDPNTGFTYIELKTGQNQFDLKKDALLIQFWKVNPQNRDSVSKNPDPLIKGYKYYEVNDNHVDRSSIKRIEIGADAVNIIKDISSKPGALKTMLKVLGKKFGNVTVLSLELEIYKTLMEYVSTLPGEFFELVEAYKRGVQDDVEKAKSFKALDLSKHGHIGFEYEGNKNLIISKAEGKGDGMIQWLIDNYYEDEVYKATQILKDLVSKLK